MALHAAAPVFAGSVQFGESKKKKAASETPPPEEQPTVTSEAAGEPVTDTLELSEPEAGADVFEEPLLPETEELLNGKFRIDKEQVNGVLGKIRVFLAEVLGLEDPQNASWLDIAVKIAKFVIDNAGTGKAPQPGI